MLIMRFLTETDCIQTKASLLKKDLKKNLEVKSKHLLMVHKVIKNYIHILRTKDSIMVCS